MGKAMIIVGFLFFSCLSTKGVYEKSELENREPIYFEYAGPFSEFAKAISRTLIETGFTIKQIDSSLGIISTDWKVLADDEMFDVSGMAVVFGGNIKSQQGRMSLLFQQTEPSRIVGKIVLFIKAEATYSFDGIRQEEMSSSAQIVPRGHPLAMKVKSLFSTIRGLHVLQNPGDFRKQPSQKRREKAKSS